MTLMSGRFLYGQKEQKRNINFYFIYKHANELLLDVGIKFEKKLVQKVNKFANAKIENFPCFLHHRSPS